MPNCIHCNRTKPDALAMFIDDTCSMGGRCEWSEDEEEKKGSYLPAPRKLQRVGRMWMPLLGVQYPTAHWGTFTAQPDLYFKPVGLMLWDLPDDAILEQCKVMNQEVIICSHGKLPAKAFARAESYEALKKRVDDGEELFNEWMDAPAISPANRVYLLLSSASNASFANTRAAFWGHSYS